MCDILNMDKLVKQMSSPAPVHIIDGLHRRLMMISASEGDTGQKLAHDCKQFLSEQSEVQWVHILMMAYMVNDGVILRDVNPSPVTGPLIEVASDIEASSHDVIQSTSELRGPSPNPITSLGTDFGDDDLQQIQNMVDELGI